MLKDNILLLKIIYDNHMIALGHVKPTNLTLKKKFETKLTIEENFKL